MILIYSRDTDDFVNEVIDYLDEDFVRIGDRDKIHIDEIHIDEGRGVFTTTGEFFEIVDIEKLKTIWFNGGMATAINANDYENECYLMLFNSFFNYKSINKLGRLNSNFELNKIDVPLEAQKQGFKIPDTLITGSKNKLTGFFNKYKDHDGIICKRITDTYYYENEDKIYDFNFTFSITPNILIEVPEQFAISLFQERILADFEIRVIFINGDFYAMSIHSFDIAIDYRSNLMSENDMRMIPFKLPIEIEKKLQKVFERFDLNFGSADLMYRNNEYYFLEVNPIGQISFVNNACNYYIEKKLLTLLKQ